MVPRRPNARPKVSIHTIRFARHKSLSSFVVNLSKSAVGANYMTKESIIIEDFAEPEIQQRFPTVYSKNGPKLQILNSSCEIFTFDLIIRCAVVVFCHRP
jgi:hypothetical protein